MRAELQSKTHGAIGPKATPWADRAALFLLLLEVIIALLTFRDYGLGWDDYTQAEYGDLLLSLYGSGFNDRRAFSFVNLYYYGGGFDMLAALAAKILPFTLFETRRLINVMVGIVGLAATWRLGRRVGGPLAGLIALILLAACPVFDGHMYINAKDAPFATAMTILLLGIVAIFAEYPVPRPRTAALLGLGIGLAFGARVLAAVAVFSALAALATVVVDDLRKGRATGARLLQFIWLALPALVIGYLITGLLWPWSVLSPLNPLYASDYFSVFFEKPWRELYEGRLYPVPNMPPSYLPHMLAIKLPEIMTVLGLTGAGFALVAGASGRLPAKKSSGLFAVIAAGFLPVLLAMAAHPALYNGIRHFLFVIPPFAVCGGLSGAAAFDWAWRHGRVYATACAVLFAIGIALPISDIVWLHPFQYSAFNTISGGVKMAHHNYMVDYWGLAFKQAGESLRAELAKRHESPPAGRRWIIEICGPQRGAEVALGPDFQTTWDRQTADFAMMLGTYYCRDDIRVPVLVEVRREGTLYARVYDMRGRVMPNLLTVPPP